MTTVPTRSEVKITTTDSNTHATKVEQQDSEELAIGRGDERVRRIEEDEARE
jgi:hypothetical protein